MSPIVINDVAAADARLVPYIQMRLYTKNLFYQIKDNSELASMLKSSD